MEKHEGWVCPICKKVYSPEIKSCPKCSVTEEPVDSDIQFLTEE